MIISSKPSLSLGELFKAMRDCGLRNVARSGPAQGHPDGRKLFKLNTRV